MPKTVVTSSIEGNVLNSSEFRVYRTISMISRLNTRFVAINASSITVGTGIMSIIIPAITATGTITSLLLPNISPPTRNALQVKQSSAILSSVVDSI
jgi:hypothetical protein